MVVHTSSKAAHQDPSTVILMGAACAGICCGTSCPVCVTFSTWVGLQRALYNKLLDASPRQSSGLPIGEPQRRFWAHDSGTYCRTIPCYGEDYRSVMPSGT